MHKRSYFFKLISTKRQRVLNSLIPWFDHMKSCACKYDKSIFIPIGQEANSLCRTDLLTWLTLFS